MIKEALEFLTGSKKCEPDVVKIWDTKEDIKYLVVKPDCSSEILDFKPVAKQDYRHQFTSIKSYVEFLVNEKKPGIVFVSENHIEADSDYRGFYNQKASLDLACSEEYKAFLELCHGLPQVKLWELLQTSLYDRIDLGDFLLAALGSIEIKSKEHSLIKIDRVGNASASGESGYEITYPDAKGEGERSAEFPIEYKFRGRLWEYWEKEFTINARLIIKMTDGGLIFRFVPRGIDQVFLQARAELVAELKSLLKDTEYQVYQGAM